MTRHTAGWIVCLVALVLTWGVIAVEIHALDARHVPITAVFRAAFVGDVVLVGLAAVGGHLIAPRRQPRAPR
jgi:hypothetical protein